MSAQQPDRRQRLEQALEEAGLSVIVEEEEELLRLEGIVDTPEAKQAAADVILALEPGARLENNLAIEEIVPATPAELEGESLAVVQALNLPEDLAELEAQGGEYEPDFTDQALETSPVEMAGEASTSIDPDPDGETVFFPPTDPVVTFNRAGELEVLGGFAPTAMDEDEAAPSALDDQPGDEALASAVRRELRRDALTTDLSIQVAVRDGQVYLRGTVASLDDVESAEEVAGRVPGVEGVVEQLTVTALEQRGEG